MLDGDELASLAESGRSGWIQPCIRDGGLLIEGRNRVVCSLINGVDVEFDDLGGRDAEALIIKLNLDRRHLSASQLAVFGSDLAGLQHGQRGPGKEGRTRPSFFDDETPLTDEEREDLTADLAIFQEPEAPPKSIAEAAAASGAVSAGMSA